MIKNPQAESRAEMVARMVETQLWLRMPMGATLQAWESARRYAIEVTLAALPLLGVSDQIIKTTARMSSQIAVRRYERAHATFWEIVNHANV